MAFKAYSKDCSVSANTAREAAQLFFAQFKNKRKCNLIEGEIDGAFFTVRYDPKAWPQSYKNVTLKTIGDLPCA